MDNLFKSRVLTASVNEMRTDVKMLIYDRFFRGKERMSDSSLLAFDIIFGSEKLLPNISVSAEATVTTQTGRRTVTMKAPRLASKRFIEAAYFDSIRGYGQQVKTEMVKDKIAREQADMKGEHDRTLEYWAASAMKGVILDSDLTTELVNYNVDPTHKPVLAGAALWTDSASDPIQDISNWKQLIEDDAQTGIDGWVAYCGKGAMDAMVKNERVLAMLAETSKDKIARMTGQIDMLDGVEIIKYTGSFIHTDGTRKRFIDDNQFLLIGVCNNMTDTPYAPIVDMNIQGGIGNVNSAGRGLMFFSKSWEKNDPSGRWIKNEARPLPVLKRPGAIVDAQVIV